MTESKRIETHPTMPIPRDELKPWRRVPSVELNAVAAQGAPPALVEDLVRAQESYDVADDRPTVVPCPGCSGCPHCRDENGRAQHVVTVERAVAIEDELVAAAPDVASSEPE